MRSIVYRFLSFLVALLFSISLIASALAVDDGDNGSEYVQKSSFVQWAGSFIQDWIGFSFGAACPESEDGYHHSSSTLGHPVDIFGQESPYYECICTYCGAKFTAYETDLKQSYDNQVAELPAPGYGSDGSLLWSPQIGCFWLYGISNGMLVKRYYSGCPHYIGANGNNEINASISFDCDTHFVTAWPSSGYSSFLCNIIYFEVDDVYPIDGYYTLLDTTSVDGYCIESSERITVHGEFERKVGIFYNSSDSCKTIYSCGVSSSSAKTFLAAQVFAPVYKIIPLSSMDTFLGNQYNITTRPTSITGGNYGIIGDNGQITQVTDNSTIVNETNNTYYNPATGETVPITDWSYDYSDRSYTVTTENGDTYTVTYGDENITITEITINESGDTITNNYTIYYIIEGSGTGTGSENPPAACTHNWQETSTTPATCTVPGSRLLTCSLCNQTKTETIPALGHNWQVKQTVTTQYDDTGQLIQQGYTIFECSICHEQYKSQDGTIPPGSSGNNSGDEGEEKEGFLSWLLRKAGELLGAVGNGIISFLQSILDGIFDGLISLVNSTFENLAQLVDLFGSFGDALGVLWTWLPPEIMVVLVAGVSVFVLIALLKLFMK